MGEKKKIYEIFTVLKIKFVGLDGLLPETSPTVTAAKNHIFVAHLSPVKLIGSRSKMPMVMTGIIVKKINQIEHQLSDRCFPYA